MPIVTLGDISLAHLALFKHAVGVDYHLTDVNGDPRDATNAEAQDWLKDRAKELVRRVSKAEKEAAAPVVPDEINIT